MFTVDVLLSVVLDILRGHRVFLVSEEIVFLLRNGRRHDMEMFCCIEDVACISCSFLHKWLDQEARTNDQIKHERTCEDDDLNLAPAQCRSARA